MKKHLSLAIALALGGGVLPASASAEFIRGKLPTLAACLALTLQ